MEIEAVAKARYVKVSPQKARLVADLIRGKTVNQALAILMTQHKNASRIIETTLDSAVANAVQKAGEYRLDVDKLVVSGITVDGGPITMRWRPRARGRATKIRHRTSHITIRIINTAAAKPKKGE